MPGIVRAAIPMLMCADAAAEIAFCAAAFGARELSRRANADGKVLHATLGIGELLIMVHDESPHLASRAPAGDGRSPVVIYLHLEDVGKRDCARLRPGARVLTPIADHFWVDRMGGLSIRRGMFGMWLAGWASVRRGAEVDPMSVESSRQLSGS